MLLGFTGSRDGITSFQRAGLLMLLAEEEPDEGHHGDCIGADSEFHDLCAALGIWIAVHPPDNPRYRAFRRSPDIWPEKPYLERDRDIVNATGKLLACPKGPMVPRSGTWYTIGYAWSRRKPVTVLWPDGRIDVDTFGPGQLS